MASVLCNIPKNQVKTGMMESEVMKCYTGGFYMKNPILFSLVL